MVKKIEIINLTPHDVNVYNKEGKLVRIYPYSGNIARCESKDTVLGEIEGFEVCRQTYGRVINLPNESDNPNKIVAYIVSRIVAEAASAEGRNDLLVPGRQVRDADGRILGCEGLAVV